VSPLACLQQLLAAQRPLVMGIVNLTPDSFSDGGKHDSPEAAVAAALRMVAAGANLVDIGGESTRPGAAAVDADEELRRVVPVISALAKQGVLVSVDTSKASVMRESIKAGAVMINDVRALREPEALQAVVECQVPVCLMHMQGQPRTMQQAPDYDDVVTDVKRFLQDRLDTCIDAGLNRSLLLVDPGFGFGKTLAHNLCLLRNLQAFATLGCPLLVGLSRKRLFGTMLGLQVKDRLHASVAAALMAVERGARIVRVHDVRATAHAMGVFTAVECGFTAAEN